jgi:hypothetical protein
MGSYGPQAPSLLRCPRYEKWTSIPKFALDALKSLAKKAFALDIFLSRP